VVISTADHEFQGLAMIEAVSAGASPVVPDALCYREQYPEQHRYPSGDMAAAAALVKQALGACEQVNQGEVDISDWTSDKTAPIWRAFLQYKAQPQSTAE
jgi:isopropylmalate/homocitrate/citramalate synthase